MPCAWQTASAFDAGERRVEPAARSSGRDADGLARRRARGRAPPSRRARRRRRGRRAARPRPRCPRSSPPPPTGTTITSRRARPRGSRARRCPGRPSRSGSSNGWTSTRRSRQVLLEARERAGGVLGLSVDPGAERSGAVQLELARALPREDERSRAPPRPRPRRARSRGCRRTRPATPRVALLGVERGEPVDDAARLERARVLEQLGLEHSPGASAEPSSSGVRRTRPRIVSAAPDDVVARHGASAHARDPSTGGMRRAAASHVRRMRRVSRCRPGPSHPVRLVVARRPRAQSADRLLPARCWRSRTSCG